MATPTHPRGEEVLDDLHVPARRRPVQGQAALVVLRHQWAARAHQLLAHGQVAVLGGVVQRQEAVGIADGGIGPGVSR